MANHNGVYYSNSSGLNLRTSTTTRINISTGGVIQFNSAYTFPTSDGSANTVLLTNGSGALSFGTVPNAGLTNSSITINGIAVSLGGSITVGDITSVVAGSGLTGGGTSGAVTLNVGAGTGITVAADTVGLDYSGTDNFIDSATNLEGTAIASTDTIIYHDATDNNVKKGLVSDLPFSNNSGTVTSVAITGTDGIDVDSGSPITSSGTITLGLSNIPNSALSNSSVTVGSTSISLGSTSTTLAGLSSVTSTAFVGDLTGDVNGNASTADSWAVSRTLTLGTDLSGSATFNGGSNFTLNASIVSGAVGPTELASNAVITTKISDGNVTNAKLANSTITFNAPTGSDPVVSLGGSFNLISSNGTVSISGNSTTDTIDFVVDNSVNTYVTGGTFSSGTLTLGLNDGTSASSVGGFWTSIPNSALANSSITINGSAISLGGSINVGDITGVTAGNGLTGGGTTGTVTLNVGAGTGITVAADTVGLDYLGADNFIKSATNSASTPIDNDDFIVYSDGATGNVHYGYVNDLPFSNNAGTVTSVNLTAGALIDVSGGPITSSGSITVAVDLSELTDMTATMVGTDEFVVLDASAQRRKAANEIGLSIFNNDAGFTTNTGTVTSVAITGTDGIDVDSGSPITTSGTITLGLSNVPNSSLANSSISIAGTPTSLGGSVTGDDIIANVSAGQINNSQLINSSITINSTVVALGDTINVGDINGITAGTGLTGGGTSGTVTVSLDYAGTDNFIDSATNLEGTGIALTDTIIYHDATDNNVKKGLVSDLPYTNSSGTVTSVAISGTDGIDVDSGSPITTSGTITLGLSNVPNSSLTNSAVTVTAGNGLVNGGSVSLGGSVTLNVAAAVGGGISVGVNDISLDTSSTRNVDHSSVSISAGTGLSGGGTIAATRTISLDYAGTNNFIDSATNLEGTGISTSDTIVYHDATDNNVKKGFVSDLPFSNNSGTVTSVGITAGSLIDVTGGPITTSGNITVNVDLSELATSTTDGDGDYFAVIDTSNAQRKLTKANINLSGFNDNISLYRANGALTGDRLINQNNNNLDISAIGTERFQVYTSLVTPRVLPRVRFEAIAPYSAVVELESSDPATFIIDGYSAGAPVFSVDGLGNLVATSKAFDIPHPNPEKREQGARLKHGNLEGPEHGVYVRGRQIDDKEIELPEYWRDLVDPDSITVQLTSVGSHQNLYVKKIEDNVVYIGNGNLFSNKIDCYYFIQAERKDIVKIQVEYTR